MRLFRQCILIVVGCLVSASIFAEEAINKNTAATSAQSAASVVSAKTSVTQKTDLNKASAQELLLVKGLNTSKVRAIITYRKKNNGFKSLDDLSQVKGMKRLKPEELKEIQDQLRL